MRLHASLRALFLLLLSSGLAASACFSSNGLDTSTQGYVVDNGVSYIDYCEANTLKKYYCAGASRAVLSYECTLSCKAGACEKGLYQSPQAAQAPPLWPFFAVASAVAVAVVIFHFAIRPAGTEQERTGSERERELREQVLRRARGEF